MYIFFEHTDVTHLYRFILGCCWWRYRTSIGNSTSTHKHRLCFFKNFVDKYRNIQRRWFAVTHRLLVVNLHLSRYQVCQPSIEPCQKKTLKIENRVAMFADETTRWCISRDATRSTFDPSSRTSKPWKKKNLKSKFNFAIIFQGDGASMASNCKYKKPLLLYIF